MLPQCLSHVFLSDAECLHLRPSVCTRCVWRGKRVRKEGRKEGRDLSGALAKHLIGSQAELTFEGCRSSSLKMKKKKKRIWRTRERLGMQQAFCSLLSMDLSILSLCTASSPVISTHPSPPPPHTVDGLSLCIYWAQGEEKGRTEMKGARRNTVRGWPREGWMSMRGMARGMRRTDEKRIRAEEGMRTKNFRCLI